MSEQTGKFHTDKTSKVLICEACLEKSMNGEDRAPCVMVIKESWGYPELCPYEEGKFASWEEVAWE
jgi:hypothetical protein